VTSTFRGAHLAAKFVYRCPSITEQASQDIYSMVSKEELPDSRSPVTPDQDTAPVLNEHFSPEMQVK
jgi:hypothetical protein